MIRAGSDPGSLEGLIERGRGAGWAAAFAHPERAREVVIDCVLRDPRWDRQIESRAEHYAQLLLALEAPLGAVVDAARAAPEDAISLARHVAEELARRGAPVPPELAGDDDHAEGSGVRPHPAGLRPTIDSTTSTEALLASASMRNVRALVDVICQRTSGRDRLLVGRAVRSGHDDARSVALWTLGRWKDPTAFTIVDDTLDAIDRGAVPRRMTRACWEYLVALGGDEALSRARRWCALGYPWRLVADHVLAAHAVPEDLERLQIEVERALREEELYRVRSLAAALARTTRDAVATLERVWCESRYSFARDQVLEAIVALVGPEHPFVLEALWDCEAGVRADACRLARGPVAEARRRELAADPWEDPEVRRAAEVDSARP